MASRAAIIGGTDPAEPDTAVEEREGLLHSSRDQEIRNRAYEIYLHRGGSLAMSWRTGCGPNANSQRISLVVWYWLYRPPRKTGLLESAGSRACFPPSFP